MRLPNNAGFGKHIRTALKPSNVIVTRGQPTNQRKNEGRNRDILVLVGEKYNVTSFFTVFFLGWVDHGLRRFQHWGKT